MNWNKQMGDQLLLSFAACLCFKVALASRSVGSIGEQQPSRKRRRRVTRGEGGGFSALILLASSWQLCSGRFSMVPGYLNGSASC